MKLRNCFHKLSLFQMIIDYVLSIFNRIGKHLSVRINQIKNNLIQLYCELSTPNNTKMIRSSPNLKNNLGLKKEIKKDFWMLTSLMAVVKITRSYLLFVFKEIKSGRIILSWDEPPIDTKFILFNSFWRVLEKSLLIWL